MLMFIQVDCVIYAIYTFVLQDICEIGERLICYDKMISLNLLDMHAIICDTCCHYLVNEKT